MAADFVNEAPALHGDWRPQRELSKERPYHRIMLYMKAQGASCKKIAEAMGMHASTVANTCSQSWFIKDLAQLLHASGKGNIDSLLKIMAEDAAQVAYEIMQTSASESMRAKSAFEILKLAQGSKITVLHAEKKDGKLLEEEAKRLDEEIAALRGSN
jgi:hypothetical protein